MSYQGLILTPSTNTTFTPFGNSSYFSTTTVGNSYTMYCGPVSAMQLVGNYVTPPSTTPYTVIANVVSNPGDYCATGYTSRPTTSGLGYGIGLSDGTKYIHMVMNWNSTYTLSMEINEWTTTTIDGAVVWGQSLYGGYPAGDISWLMIMNDGTNIYFYVATDAGESIPTHWAQLYSQGVSTFLSSPSEIFWGAGIGGSTSAPPNYLTLNSWSVLPF